MPKAHILVIDDEDIMREFVEESLARAGHTVETASGGKDGLDRLAETGFDLVVTDLKMAPMDGLEVVKRVCAEHPGTRCIVMTAYGTIETAVRAMKNGAEDYILKPFAPDALEIAVDRALQRAHLEAENRYLREALTRPFGGGGLVGESAAIRKVFGQIEKVAASKSTILLRGESGTGKELVARAIHEASPRADRPFIKVNCAALSAGLLESELFGHERGAFTGAHEKKIGRFELADGGTLLLDEVTEMAPELQPKLLRALQEKEIDRVGGASSIPVDVRIIATSNRDLDRAVREGDFREDLFFRLNVIPVRLPPLRERREDIPKLLDHFLDHFTTENGMPPLAVDGATRERLQRYPWPGNVRELQNAVERAVVLASGATLTEADFPMLREPPTRANGTGEIQAGLTVAEMERQLIFQTLESCGGNRTRAAEALQISVRTLRNKLKEYREQEEKSAASRK